MRVIVTGATSFIGSHMVKELCARGFEVCALVRPNSANRDKLHSDKTCQNELLEIIECELRNIKYLAKEKNMKKADFWLHLGWDGSGSDNRKLADIQSMNAIYALEALDTASALGCRRFLFCGSQAEYGVRNTKMFESDELNPISEYGKAKARVGMEALKKAKELNIAYIHARVFSVYGQDDHPWSLVESCIHAFSKDKELEFGDCTQLWNYLYISDAVDILIKLLTEDIAAGVYNVAGEDTRPLRNYIEEIHGLCENKGKCLYGKRPPNAEGVTSLDPDITKLKTATGFKQQVSFKEGISSMIESYGLKC